MARLGRKPVKPGRATTAVTLGTVGLFVISMAAGMKSWPFGAAGAAMLVVGVALLTTASMRGSDKAFVAGTVHVVKVSDPPLTTDFGRCEMQVLLDAPGHPGQTVMIRDPRVPVNKWPEIGETLPALVSVSDARRIKIRWDQVGTYGERYETGYDESDYVPFDDTSEMDPITDEYPDPVGYSEDHSDRFGSESLDDDPDVEVIVNPVTEPMAPMPRRQPRPRPATAERSQSVAVLEGEVVPEVPEQRSAVDDDVDVLDFTADSEPDEPILVTQPNARPASAGSIHGVGITVLVTDLARSLEFYRDMLGFYEIDGGEDSVILASGDTRIVLVTSSELTPVHKRLVHLNLEVGDVDAVYQELKVRGVRFTYGPRVVNRGERLELVAASFKDPDGHGIAITQWKARMP